MKRLLKPIISLTFGIIVYLFWALPYRAALSYQEQLQLFLIDTDYFRQLLSRPDGFATCLAEFLVQFYNNYWVGAAIIALLFMLIQTLTCRLAYRGTGRQVSLTGYIIALVPVIILWLYMGDPSVMPTFMIAIALALLAALIMGRTGRLWSLVPSIVVGIPVAYWLIGPAVYVTVAWMCISIIGSKCNTKAKAAMTLCAVAYTVASVLVCSTLAPYPLKLQAVGIDYYRYPWVNRFEFLVLAAFVVIPAAMRYITRPRAELILASALAAGVLIAWLPLKGIFFNPTVYELIDYDYLVRTGQWQQIINKAQRHQPSLPMSVCATNLALAATDQLCERAFQFYQNGAEGLLPQFKREPHTSMTTGEAYFQLGLTNTAQRFYFEAMEAIPNYNKSARCLKRIAETNIVNGQYEVAKKYLRLLQKTIFYRNWATRTMAMIDNGKVDEHPMYGKLRHEHIDNDFLFSTDEIDKILGQLYLKAPDNTMARQYLLMYPLLQRDINRFMQYMQVVQQKAPFMPTICQEGVAFAFMNQGQPIPQGLVSPMVSDRLSAFAKAWTQNGKDSPALDVYKNTLWYYLVKGK